MGFGLHGWGVGVVNWLVKHGARVTVTDLKTAAQLAPMLKKVDQKKIKLVLGRHRVQDFLRADLVFQNPGVPRDSKYLKIAKHSGAGFENDASLFIKNCIGKVIGVTGTRGKSTTASLIYEMLRNHKSKITNPKQIQNSKFKTFLAGLPQMPLLGILDKVRADDLAVLELSSWQLEILGRQKLSPSVAVITNIYPDHLNRYRGMADYIAAKANIIKFQKPNDICVLNRDNAETKKLGQKVRGRRFWFSTDFFPEENGAFVKAGYIYWRLNGRTAKICGVKELKLLGKHNLENALAAVAAGGILGVAPATMRQGLKSFKGLPFRNELIRERQGVKFVNDTTATTPDGTLAALKTLPPKTVVLIAGGDFKNIPDAKYQALARLIAKTCQAVVLFKGRGSRQILKFLKIKNLVSEVGTMAEAVGLANNFARVGDTVLLSPACASFNLFVNEYDRGEQFNKIVAKLK